MPRKKHEGIMVIGFVVIGVIAFVILFFGLRGKIVGKQNHINVVFADVSGLRVGDPVYILGVEKGSVRRIQLLKDRVLIVIGMDPDLPVPVNSRCYLKVGSYFAGEKYIKIDLGSGNRATTRDTLVGIDQSMAFESMLADLGRQLGSLNFDSLGSQLGREGRLLVREIKKGLEGSFLPLASSLDHATEITDRVDTLIAMLNRREGTVSKLVNSDELYKEVIATNKELRTLIKDIRENPKRYFKVEVF